MVQNLIFLLFLTFHFFFQQGRQTGFLYFCFEFFFSTSRSVRCLKTFLVGLEGLWSPKQKFFFFSKNHLRSSTPGSFFSPTILRTVPGLGTLVILNKVLTVLYFQKNYISHTKTLVKGKHPWNFFWNEQILYGSQVLRSKTASGNLPFLRRKKQQGIHHLDWEKQATGGLLKNFSIRKENRTWRKTNSSFLRCKWQLLEDVTLLEAFMNKQITFGARLM